VTIAPDQEKLAVPEFWNRQSCGEVYARGESLVDQLEAQARSRYYLECADAELLPFPDNSFDIVYSCGLIRWLMPRHGLMLLVEARKSPAPTHAS
jgi:hypothetical protein